MLILWSHRGETISLAMKCKTVGVLARSPALFRMSDQLLGTMHTQPGGGGGGWGVSNTRTGPGRPRGTKYPHTCHYLVSRRELSHGHSRLFLQSQDLERAEQRAMLALVF